MHDWPTTLDISLIYNLDRFRIYNILRKFGGDFHAILYFMALLKKIIRNTTLKLRRKKCAFKHLRVFWPKAKQYKQKRTNIVRCLSSGSSGMVNRVLEFR